MYSSVALPIAKFVENLSKHLQLYIRSEALTDRWILKWCNTIPCYIPIAVFNKCQISLTLSLPLGPSAEVCYIYIFFKICLKRLVEFVRYG